MFQKMYVSHYKKSSYFTRHEMQTCATLSQAIKDDSQCTQRNLLGILRKCDIHHPLERTTPYHITNPKSHIKHIFQMQRDFVALPYVLCYTQKANPTFSYEGLVIYSNDPNTNMLSGLDCGFLNFADNAMA